MSGCRRRLWLCMYIYIHAWSIFTWTFFGLSLMETFLFLFFWGGGGILTVSICLLNRYKLLFYLFKSFGVIKCLLKMSQRESNLWRRIDLQMVAIKYKQLPKMRKKTGLLEETLVNKPECFPGLHAPGKYYSNEKHCMFWEVMKRIWRLKMKKRGGGRGVTPPPVEEHQICSQLKACGTWSCRGNLCCCHVVWTFVFIFIFMWALDVQMQLRAPNPVIESPLCIGQWSLNMAFKKYIFYKWNHSQHFPSPNCTFK